jgi:hypothetical protein
VRLQCTTSRHWSMQRTRPVIANIETGCNPTDIVMTPSGHSTQVKTALKFIRWPSASWLVTIGYLIGADAIRVSPVTSSPLFCRPI